MNPNSEATPIWHRVLRDLEEHLEPGQFQEFLSGTIQEDFDGKTLVVGVASGFHRRWLMTNVDQIYKSLIRLGVGEIALQFLVRSGNSASTPPMQDLLGSPDLGRAPEQRPGQTGRLEVPTNARQFSLRPEDLRPEKVNNRLNPRYTFESLVVGEYNRFACSTAIVVADPTSMGYNPLFIHGGVGMGKTHLLHAIGHAFLKKKGSALVLYRTSEEFVNDFIAALETGSQFDFRNLYRNVDLLLLDDVQFFQGKEQMQTEFFHTFNALHEAGRKIVLSSDRPPGGLALLEERLRSRFAWGLMADLQVPDVETRMAIVSRKAAQDGINLPSDVAEYIAEHVRSSVRDLEGALARLRGYASMQNRTIDKSLCVDVLGPLIFTPEAPNRITVERIQEVTAEYFQISLRDLLSDSRQRRFSTPRHVAQYLSRQLTGLSFPEIGHKFGGRDHSSIMHACRRIEREITNEPGLFNAVNYITKQLRTSSEHPPKKNT